MSLSSKKIELSKGWKYLKKDIDAFYNIRIQYVEEGVLINGVPKKVIGGNVSSYVDKLTFELLDSFLKGDGISDANWGKNEPIKEMKQDNFFLNIYRENAFPYYRVPLKFELDPYKLNMGYYELLRILE